MAPSSLKPMLAVICLAGLAACSGGGGGDPLPTFEDYIDEGEAIFLESENLGVTDPNNLPNGTATYDGVMVLVNEEEATGLAGDLEMQANFDDGSVGGTVTNIVDPVGTRLGGSLNITNTVIDTTVDPTVEYTYQGDLGGSLTAEGQQIDVLGVVGGEFYGPNAEFTGGAAAASACIGIDCIMLDGIFDARKR